MVGIQDDNTRHNHYHRTEIEIETDMVIETEDMSMEDIGMKMEDKV